jgi:phage terminase large subunit-like protein
MVKRGDPMTWIITTAGFNPQGPNSDFLKRCKQMLDGILPGETTLPFIYELDEKDDWNDERNWIKANPGLGYVLTLDGIRAEYEQIALIGKTKEIDFKVKNLNIEHKGADTWLRMEDWEKCGGEVDLMALSGRECYAGIDLSLTDDISALALFFPKKEDEERHILKVFYWIPEEKAEIEAQNGIPYRKWIAEGKIKATDGNVIDHDDLAADIIEICKDFKMKRMEIDPWTSKTVQLALQKAGLPFGTVAQNLSSLGSPTQVFERMVKGGDLNHGGDEVLAWMASNCQIHIHASGFYMVHKGKSGKLKVDGIVASICAVYGWVDDGAKPAKSSYLFEKNAKVILI